MRFTVRCISLSTFLAWLALCGPSGAETVVIRSGRPVDDATRKLEAAYGWAITYEDPPRIFEGDLEDATARIRKDGKSASEPGVMQILLPRIVVFSFALDDRPKVAPGTRAPEEAARAAILEMLKGYAASVGGAEMFALSDSNGIFHIVPTQRKDASGKLEKIVPVLDTVVSIPPGQRTVRELVMAVCQSVATQMGVRLDGELNGNGARQRTTQIASLPNESARSILSRIFAELAMPRPISWHMYYQPGWGYALNVRFVDATK